MLLAARDRASAAVWADYTAAERRQPACADRLNGM